MIDLHVPTTDGRELLLTRYTEPEPELALLLDKLKLYQILMIGTCEGFPNRRKHASPWHTEGGCHGAGGASSGGLRRAAPARAGQASRDANQTRCLLALAAISEGGWRGEAARIGGVRIQPFDKLRSAELGAGVRRGRPGGADRRQGAGSGVSAGAKIPH
jgi:hypothetical protein